MARYKDKSLGRGVSFKIITIIGSSNIRYDVLVLYREVLALCWCCEDCMYTYGTGNCTHSVYTSLCDIIIKELFLSAMKRSHKFIKYEGLHSSMC